MFIIITLAISREKYPLSVNGPFESEQAATEYLKKCGYHLSDKKWISHVFGAVGYTYVLPIWPPFVPT